MTYNIHQIKQEITNQYKMLVEMTSFDDIDPEMKQSFIESISTLEIEVQNIAEKEFAKTMSPKLAELKSKLQNKAKMPTQKELNEINGSIENINKLISENSPKLKYSETLHQLEQFAAKITGFGTNPVIKTYENIQSTQLRLREQERKSVMKNATVEIASKNQFDIPGGRTACSMIALSMIPAITSDNSPSASTIEKQTNSGIENYKKACKENNYKIGTYLEQDEAIDFQKDQSMFGPLELYQGTLLSDPAANLGQYKGLLENLAKRATNENGPLGSLLLIGKEFYALSVIPTKTGYDVIFSDSHGKPMATGKKGAFTAKFSNLSDAAAFLQFIRPYTDDGKKVGALEQSQNSFQLIPIKSLKKPTEVKTDLENHSPQIPRRPLRKPMENKNVALQGPRKLIHNENRNNLRNIMLNNKKKETSKNQSGSIFSNLKF